MITIKEIQPKIFKIKQQNWLEFGMLIAAVSFILFDVIKRFENNFIIIVFIVIFSIPVFLIILYKKIGTKYDIKHVIIDFNQKKILRGINKKRQ